MLQPYEEYKETGVEWLGQIPEGWEAVKINELFQERRTKVSDKDYEPLSVTKNGIVPQLLNAAKSNDGDNRKLVCSGDFVINSRSDRKGSSGIAILTGSVSLINLVLEPSQQNNRRLMHYLLKSNSFIDEYYRNGRGIVADLWTTRYNEMKTITLPIPPLPEQDQIVQYLNWKTTKINKLLKAKKKQIALLKEHKQAVINKAVTKGLDNTVPMKESGVEWLGQIPQGWEVRRLRTLAKAELQYGANESGVSYISESPRYIRITDIDLSGSLKESKKLSLPKDIATPYLLSAGDILFARSGATVGKTFIFKASYEKSAFAGYLIRFKPNKELIIPEFIYNFTLGFGYKLWINNIFIQATIQNISAEKYKNLQVPVPPLSEQEAIVAYLEEKTARIDKAIAIIEKEIELVLEYKTSLISAVVTGKVDVRNVQVPYYDAEEDTIEDIEEVEDVEVMEEMEE